MSIWDWFKPKPKPPQPVPAETVGVDFNVKVATDPQSAAPPVPAALVHLIGDHDEEKRTNKDGWVRFYVKKTATLITVDITPPAAMKLQHWRRDGMSFDGQPHEGDKAYNVYLLPEAPPIPPAVVPDVTKDGDTWKNHGQYFSPKLYSLLSILPKSIEEWRARLAWVRAHKYHGVRVFCGYLGWSQPVAQMPDAARAALPAFLDEASKQGLIVELTVITGAELGYDVKAHLSSVADLARAANQRHGGKFVIVEEANEVGHGSQTAEVNFDNLRKWGQELCHGLTWACGAPVGQDEPFPDGTYPGDGGPFNTAHMKRKDIDELWSEVRRIREQHECAFDNERTGANEHDEPGRRRSDPAYFVAAGLLDRSFRVGGVHHSQAGLDAVEPGPVQTRCADAEIEGHELASRLIGGEANYYNTGHVGSPVANIPASDWDRTLGKTDGRCYSFTCGNKGLTAVLGIPKGESLAVPFQDGWRGIEVQRVTAADGSYLCVYELTR